jgi:hypothetical protein
MLSSRRVRAFVAAGAVAFLAAIVLHGCSSDQLTEPISESRVERPMLTIGGGSSSASGTVVSSRGGISCTISGSTGGATTSGTCSQHYKKGSVVSVTATPASGAALKLDQEWQGCAPNVEDRRVCQITMNSNTTVAPTFVPTSNAFTVTVSGGAGGSGTVISTPTGINCTITNGQASSGNCSAGFATSTQVKLAATASSGSYLKAWAGGGCETAGTGTGSTSGSCTTTVTANVAVVVSFDDQAPVATVGQWGAPFSWPAVAINAILLPNSKVMTYGRMVHGPVIWDPASPGSFTNLNELADIFCSGMALLPNGKLFIAGGHSGTDNFGIKTAFTYDVNTGWTRQADMRNGRWYPTVTTLPSGEMLAISGGDTAGTVNLIPEVYQPSSNTWRSLGSRNIPYYPMMFVAPNGSVYYVGPAQTTAYLNTSTGAWTTGPTRTCCYRDYGAAVMYDAGKILVVGGGNTPTASAERIDLTGTATWTGSGSMSAARRQTNATLLADGTVLVTGGTNATGFNTAPTSSAVLAAELWNPASPTTWKQLSSMSHNRLYHSTALLLPDARVLSTGSGQPAATGLTDDYTAEIFTPPYLFKADGTPATRPVISSAPTAVSYGQAFTVQTAEAASITKVTWIRLSAVTHSFNQNQRMNVLSFAAGSGSLTVNAPLNVNLAPPGHYMLFIVNANGVPSLAQIIRIG